MRKYAMSDHAWSMFYRVYDSTHFSMSTRSGTSNNEMFPRVQSLRRSTGILRTCALFSYKGHEQKLRCLKPCQSQWRLRHPYLQQLEINQNTTAHHFLRSIENTKMRSLTKTWISFILPFNLIKHAYFAKATKTKKKFWRSTPKGNVIQLRSTFRQHSTIHDLDFPPKWLNKKIPKGDFSMTETWQPLGKTRD